MNSELLDALSEHLTTGVKLTGDTVPDPLKDTDFVTKQHPNPSYCPEDDCSAAIKSEINTSESGTRRYICFNGCDVTVALSDLAKYKINARYTLQEIATHLGLTPDESTYDKDLPKYAAIGSNERIDVCLIGNPQEYEEAIEDRIKHAIRNHRVTLLIVPQPTIEPVLDIAKSYPLGSLVTPLSLQLLSKKSVVRDIVTGARHARDRTERILEQRGLDFGGTIDQLSENPSLIAAALQYLRIIREESGSNTGLGEEFEQVCKAAFAALDLALPLEYGGTAQRGQKLPDILLGFDADPTKSDEYTKALGIVDSKSGSTGNFSSEKIAGKHTEYLKQARRSEIFRDWHIAHIFVVFGIDGYKEIDWFDEIKEAYSGYDDDITMVVLYADALRELVIAAQNIAQRAELKRSAGDFSRILRPLFDHTQHSADWVSSQIASMTRIDPDNPSQREQDYIRQYHQRPQLLVITQEMVHTHLQNCSKQKQWGHLLEGYHG